MSVVRKPEVVKRAKVCIFTIFKFYFKKKGAINLLPLFCCIYYFEEAGKLVPRLYVIGTLLPAGDTLTYPDISW